MLHPSDKSYALIVYEPTTSPRNVTQITAASKQGVQKDTIRHYMTTSQEQLGRSEQQEVFSGETRIKQQKENVYLSVVPVELIGLDSTRTRTYALLDPGSHHFHATRCCKQVEA